MCWDSMWKREESKLRSWELLLLDGNGNGNGCSRSNSIVEFLRVEFVQQLMCRQEQEEEERNRKEMEGVYETHSH